MNKKLLFVCTGNYYRSRFAEIYFNNFAPEGWIANSAGFDISNPENIGYISMNTKKKLKKLNIPISKKVKPKKITENDIEEADMIIAMNGEEHEKLVKSMFFKQIDKFNYWHIKDLYEEKPSISLENLKIKLDLLIINLTRIDTTVQEKYITSRRM